MDEQEAIRIAEELLRQKSTPQPDIILSTEQVFATVDEINQRHGQSLCERFQTVDIMLLNLISVVKASYEQHKENDDLVLSQQLEAILELITDQHECYHVIISALQNKLL